MLKMIGLAALAVSLATPALAASGYAKVDGLNMYYETTGSGDPIVLLHGAYMSIDSNWKDMVPVLAKDHQVIAVELQAHGRTADIDRPITYEGMADDVSGLLDQLQIPKATLFGYSMGAGVALQVAIRHPAQINRLVIASASFSSDGLPAGFMDMVKQITPEMMKGTPYEAEYLRLSPNKAGFPQLVEKLKQLDETPFDWTAEAKKITAPTLLIFGDADIITIEHATSMYRGLGGNTNGDMTGVAKVEMMVLPGTSHTGVFKPENVAILQSVVPAFLKAQIPAKGMMQ